VGDGWYGHRVTARILPTSEGSVKPALGLDRGILKPAEKQPHAGCPDEGACNARRMLDRCVENVTFSEAVHSLH
jgi:hypothetical protein